jgi:predicted 2-oxoglutarate/Fe(II)-dependent dioxygenase YbiX
MNEYIKIYSNLISVELCQEIINQKDLEFLPATVDAGDLTSHRNCYNKVLDKQFESAIFDIVGRALKKYAKDIPTFTLGLTCEDTGYQHLLYKGSEKGEYKEHTDHFDLHPRILSCSIILNDNYDGGDFTFFKGKYIVKKEAATILMFPSNFCFPHAVTSVTNGDRHSIVTWFH